METLTNIFTTLDSIAWGPYMLALIGFTGLYLIIGLKFMPLIKIPYAVKLLSAKPNEADKFINGNLKY